MKFPQVWQQMLIGSIMRTLIWPSAGRFPRGTFAGSKSGGMYLLRTLRSPIFYVSICVKVVVYVVRMNNNALSFVCVSLWCFIMRKRVFADDV